MQRPNRVGFGILAAFVFFAACGVQGCRGPQVRDGLDAPRTALRAQRTGHLAHTDLVEASGMVHSRREDGLLWLINDGGHPPALYAVATNGGDRGRVIVDGARNTDWEDLAAFDLNGRNFLVIADVGDNRAVRKTRRIYVVEEPRRDNAGVFPEAVGVAWQFAFRYADGPRDCEGVAVAPRAGQILLITKRTQPPQLYALSLEPPEEGRLQTARRVGAVPRIPPPTVQDRRGRPRLGGFLSQPTAMDIRADNRLAVVLTYKDAYLFPRATGTTWAAALANKPVAVALPDLKQKEAVCFDRRGRTVYITTEQRPAPLLGVSLPPGF